METLSEFRTFADLTKDLERPANWCVVAIDETKFWRDDIKEKAGKILSVYFVNLMEPTNLCSFDINYPATHLYNVVENFEAFDEDELFEIENNADDECRYFHEYTRFEKCVPSYMPQSWFDEMKEEGENWEETQIEYERCNHHII